MTAREWLTDNTREKSKQIPQRALLDINKNLLQWFSLGETQAWAEMLLMQSALTILFEMQNKREQVKNVLHFS